MLSTVKKYLLREAVLKQGLHIDPLDADAPERGDAWWGPIQRSAFASREMDLFRDGLRFEPGSDIRASVLDDLGQYFGYSADECLQRCLHWEELSREEWLARPRDSVEALTDFYLTTTSWNFDLLWYAYLQSEGYGFPAPVMIARFVRQQRVTEGTHLDFGSGVGVTSQLFRRLGFDSDLADISTPLLEFARFRLDRRTEDVKYIDLNNEHLAVGRYDAITAIDTLVHVPDLAATAKELRAALRPGGWLFANFDVRPKTEENAWHLYDNDLRLRWTVQRAGFEPRGVLDGVIRCYQAVEASGVQDQVHRVRDAVVLRNPARRYTDQVRWPTPSRVRSAARKIRSRLSRADGDST